MIFKSRKAALESRMRFLDVKDITSDIFLNHCKKYYFYDDLYDHRKFGKYFLYEKEVDNKLYYPRLAIYVNEIICDQTTEVEYIDKRRSCEWNINYKEIYEDGDGVSREYINNMSDTYSNIETTILWNDSMYVYGAWDSMPNWKQLRQAYERTWWFHRTEDEKRDIQLDRLLK